MSYREVDPTEPGEPQIIDVTTKVDIVILNGAAAEFALPCRYVLPPVPPSLENVIQPIDLIAEGYDETPIVAFANAPAGLSGTAWIAADEDGVDSVVRVIFAAMCPSAITQDVTTDVSVLISRADDDGHTRTDIVLHGPLTVKAGPFAPEFEVLPPPDPEPDVIADLFKTMLGYGVTEEFAGSVSGETLTLTAGAVLLEGRTRKIDPEYNIDLTGFSSARIIARYSAITDLFEFLAVDPFDVLVQTPSVFELTLATMTKAGIWGPPVFEYEMAGTPFDPVGSYRSFAMGTIPRSHLVADGSEVSRVTYARLFDAIGETYGIGDGATTFNLPDRRGRVGVALATGDAEFGVITNQGGAKTHTLTTAQIPAHNHKVHRSGGGTASNGFFSGDTEAAYGVTDNAGGGGAHPNLQPYAVEVVCIRA